MSEKNFNNIGNNFYPVNNGNLIKDLPGGVYKIQMTMNGPVIEKVKDKFEFNYKIYSLQDSFIKRVVTSFSYAEQNLGVGLIGLKGSGKSVTAEMIANEMIAKNIPVFSFNSWNEGFCSVIENMKQECVLYFDEFEKTFYDKSDGIDYSDDLLSIMDGSKKSKYKKLFLLTANTFDVSSYIKSRPGRVRYVKHFSQFDQELTIKIVDDLLVNKEFREDVIDFVSSLKNITVDTVKSVIKEVDLYKESPKNFKDFFNVEIEEDCYRIYIGGQKDIQKALMSADKSPKILSYRCNLDRPLKDFRKGYGFHINSNIDGRVYLGAFRSFNTETSELVLSQESDEVGGGKGKYKDVTYTLEKIKALNSSFQE